MKMAERAKTMDDFYSHTVLMGGNVDDLAIELSSVREANAMAKSNLGTTLCTISKEVRNLAEHQ